MVLVMRFNWGELKSAKNVAERGLSFAEATEIFDGPLVLFDDSRRDYGERRQVALGIWRGEVILLVVFTNRDEVRRIISARKANSRERKLYHESQKV